MKIYDKEFLIKAMSLSEDIRSVLGVVVNFFFNMGTKYIICMYAYEYLYQQFCVRILIDLIKIFPIGTYGNIFQLFIIARIP